VILFDTKSFFPLHHRQYRSKKIDDQVFNRIRHAVTASSLGGEEHQQENQSPECETLMRQYVSALETNRQRALATLEKEDGLEN
jgi:hypothetical protein